MKHLSFTFLIILLNSYISFSQFEWGMKAGISSYQLGSLSLKEWTTKDKFSVHFTEAEYGHHFGLYSRVKIVNFYIEPSLLFHSSTFSYTLEEYSEAGAISIIQNERYNYVNIPLLVGMKIGFFRIQGGPVGNFFISKTSDLWNVEGYNEKFKTFTYGIQGGLGVDIWRFRFDVNYERNLSRLGNHVTIGGQDFNLSTNPPRFIFTLGYKF